MRFLKKLIPFRKRKPQIAVVRLVGVIGSSGSFRRGLNLRAVEPALEAAFKQKKTTAVALLINSPGGSPVQADLIQKRIGDLSQESGKPVFVFCEDVAASGGYWIALVANEIYANPSSIIGSIGVVSASFGFQEAISKIGVERRLYATGSKKGMLDPFQAEDADHVLHLKSLQNEIFDLFCEWVTSRRGARLNGNPEELFSGAFWTGQKAKELGLVDGIGEMRSVMQERFGKDVTFKTYGQKTGLLARLRLSGEASPDNVRNETPGDIVSELLELIESRLLWNKFGL
ncbi:MAG: S49 family peptidase [Rhodospirillaceae bacterium]|nr:S49 family peptidase [Rhodospirillaceae bacterium]|tara:strand:+ start:527 stop:1387 length:861 start_codon:yes stop_codon:yes gene_type:complete